MSSNASLLDLAKATEELQNRKLSLYRPHPKQQEFHKAGSTKRERVLLAANRSGKTLCCGFESAMHATGRYPEWWEGKVFRKPTLGWAAGESNETTRDIVQAILLGSSEDTFGTGAIPASDIIKIDKAPGIRGAVDKAYIRHQGGGQSVIQFKSYQQGWLKWTGAEVDWVWPDEEPPEEIYKEALTRTNNTNGIVFMSLTPLMGMTDVVCHFYPKPDTSQRSLTMMTIDDALHFTDEQKAYIIEQYQPYEREARLRGVPMLGSGRVFPIAEDVIRAHSFVPPPEWPSIIGIDFGWDHPTAATKLRIDLDSDCIYVTNEYRVSEEMPVVHARAIKTWGDGIPVVWPHDAKRFEATSGKALSNEYAKEGLFMWHEHATFQGGGNGLEAGLMEMLDRMRTNRWKVFDSCPMFFEEFRSYHRKDGKVIPIRDDLISAARYGMMMKRFATTPRRIWLQEEATDWNPLSMEAI